MFERVVENRTLFNTTREGICERRAEAPPATL